MEFKLPYVLAMREQAPKLFNRLRRTGALDSHLQAKSEEAHRLFEELTAGAPKLPSGYPRNPWAREAEEQVRALLIEFPSENAKSNYREPQPPESLDEFSENVVYKGREVDVVVVFNPPGGGPSMVRDEGTWMTLDAWSATLGPDLAPLTVGELASDWRLVFDTNEASSLVKEASRARAEMTDAAAASASPTSDQSTKTCVYRLPLGDGRPDVILVLWLKPDNVSLLREEDGSWLTLAEAEAKIGGSITFADLRESWYTVSGDEADRLIKAASGARSDKSAV